MSQRTDISTGNETNCNKCDGTGWITYEDENGYDCVKECECRKKKIEQNRINFANIPDAYKDMRMKNFKYSVYKTEASKTKIMVALKIIKKYLGEFDEYKERGLGLFIYSDTKGTGKTRMAASIANEFIKKEIKVKFATSTAILKEIRSTWDKEKEYSESALIDSLCMADVLIIDDFGTEQYKDWIGEKFYQIINERYVNKRVTIFTSNYSVDTIKYDDRIKSRIKEITFPVEFPNESVRNYIAENNRKEMYGE